MNEMTSFKTFVFLLLFHVSLSDDQDTFQSLWMEETMSVPKVSEEKYESDYDPPFILRGAPISADVILHSTYFDIEETSTSYLFLMEVTREQLDKKTIVGCGVGKLKAKNFDLTVISPDGKKKKSTDSLEVILRCRDLPLLVGDRGYVLYKFIDDIVLAVESQKPVSFYAKRFSRSNPDFTVLTCVNANDNDTPWLGEFLRYQKKLGVDHVHVSVFDEYIMSGRMFEQVDTMEDVKNLVLDDYVTLNMWNNWYEVNAKVPNQYSSLVRKLDCILHYRYLYDYVFALDTDDFFTPVGPTKDIKSYITKWCPHTDKAKSSCSFRVKRYFPGHCKLKSGSHESSSGNITDFLESLEHEEVKESRAVLDSFAVSEKVNVDSSCQDCLLKDFGIVDVPESEAYIAKMDKYAHTKKC